MQGPKIEKHHHHILTNKTIVGIGICLYVFTILTVAVAHIDLGRLNFVVAMLIASIKACLVALFFMNLLYDRRENGVIFGTSFVFLAIFIVLTSTDLFFRGDVYVKGPLAAPVAGGKSKLVKPWVSTPQLVAHGKELFMVQCTPCHGAEGKGNGPAAASLNPHPRNFTSDQGWVNGRKPSQVFKTLKEGVKDSAMASFATLPADDRWALAHYVLSLGPTPPEDSPADLAKVGIDVNKAGGGGGEEEKTIPVSLAMSRMEVPETFAPVRMNEKPPTPTTLGGRLYQDRCARCHGIEGEGRLRVRNLGVNPQAFVKTPALNAQNEAMKSPDSFSRAVVQGLPGDLMPSYGQFGKAELGELYQYVKSLPASK